MIQRMYVALPGLQPYDIPSHAIAGILWLDKARGIADDYDYVIVSRSLAGWLMMEFEVLDPAIQNARIAAMLDKEFDENSSDYFYGLVSSPFSIRFSEDESVPKNISGQVLAIAVMDELGMEERLGDNVFAISMHADGSLVGPLPTRRHVVQTP